MHSVKIHIKIYFTNINWIKTRDTNGSKTNDATEYTGEEIATLSASINIGGTWSRNNYTITYNANGGSFSNNSTENISIIIAPKK